MSTRSSSPVGIHYIYRNIRPTPLAVYIIEYAFRISRYGVFQGFPLGEVLLDHGIQYVTRRVFHSSMVQYFQVPYSGYTLSPRHNWPSVVLLIYSQYSLHYGLQYYSSTLGAQLRNKCTRYSEHTWNICCDAGCCSCWSCCRCPSGDSAVVLPPSLAA